jgi:hypothetical protein
MEKKHRKLDQSELSTITPVLRCRNCEVIKISKLLADCCDINNNSGIVEIENFIARLCELQKILF